MARIERTAAFMSNCLVRRFIPPSVLALVILVLVLGGCGMITPSVQRDIPYSQGLQFDKAFDCAIRAAREQGFSQIAFSDPGVGTFVASKSGATALSAVYNANFMIDKNASVVHVELKEEYNAGIPATQSQLSAVVDLLRESFQRCHGGS